MNSPKKAAPLTLLQTGVPGLDEVLSGGLPEYSFNLLAGAPGAGKTTLVHQLLFANASPQRPAIYFTVLGEPSLKMLRYQQQMEFFEGSKVGTDIRFVDLSDDVIAGNLNNVLESIVRHVTEVNPGLVVVDSFRTVLRSPAARTSEEMDLQRFLQRLALHLSTWQATTFLVGEYAESEMQDNPVFTIADGIMWLSQLRDRNSIVRKLQVMKMRGQAPMPGLHTFRISSAGVQVFPRIQARLEPSRVFSGTRHGFGVPELDRLLSGGIPVGDAVLVAGPAGAGKTIMGTHFIDEGARQGERVVLALFEEHPDEYIHRADAQGFEFSRLVADKQLQIICLRPLDLSADEILREVQQAVSQSGATRLVLDSLNGLELALAPTFRDDFRESLFRMVGGLTGQGVTVLMTVEVTESFTVLNFSPHQISFLSQNIIFLRYVEVEGQLRRVLTVVKMRRSQHSHDLTEFTIGVRGLKMGARMQHLQGILTGVPANREPAERSVTPGLTSQEAVVLDALTKLREGTATTVTDATGLDADVVRAALTRLSQLNYSLQIGQGDEAIHRAVLEQLLR